MKSLIKYFPSLGMGLVFFGLTALTVITSSYSGCEKTEPSTNGNGTVMNCWPPTGCGNKWYGSTTGLCYATANACSQAGNSHCRQCY